MSSENADNSTKTFSFDSNERFRYSIRLDHESFSFCASHFISFPISSNSFLKESAGNASFNHSLEENPETNIEPLHGHDFRVRVTIEGNLNRNDYVLDFVAASEVLKSVLLQFHHKILLPKNNPQFLYQTANNETEVCFQKNNKTVKRWVFPKEDVLFLPVSNTTTEKIAQIIAVEFFEKISKGGLLELTPDHYNLFLELEESRGMSANIFYNPNSQSTSFSACDDYLAQFSWRR